MAKRKTTPGLPFLITAQTVGAQKAHAEFVKRYGTADGPRILLAKANEHGKGKTAREKVNSVYKKGGKLTP